MRKDLKAFSRDFVSQKGMVINMSNEELVKKIFELVMKEIAKLEAEQAGAVQAAGSAQAAGSCACGAASFELGKKVLSESDVKQAHRCGACEIIVSRKAIITCLAAEYANRRGITITRKP